MIRGLRAAPLSLLLLLITMAPAHPAIDQRPMPGPSPSAELFGYYRRYPERYLRISEHTWRFDPSRSSAIHSFTLKNVATAPYYYIHVRFTYVDAVGKVLHTREVQVLQGIAGLGTKQIRTEVKGAPGKAERAVLTIESARIILY